MAGLVDIDERLNFIENLVALEKQLSTDVSSSNNPSDDPPPLPLKPQLSSQDILETFKQLSAQLSGDIQPSGARTRPRPSDGLPAPPPPPPPAPIKLAAALSAERVSRNEKPAVRRRPASTAVRQPLKLSDNAPPNGAVAPRGTTPSLALAGAPHFRSAKPTPRKNSFQPKIRRKPGARMAPIPPPPSKPPPPRRTRRSMQRLTRIQEEQIAALASSGAGIELLDAAEASTSGSVQMAASKSARRINGGQARRGGRRSRPKSWAELPGDRDSRGRGRTSSVLQTWDAEAHEAEEDDESAQDLVHRIRASTTLPEDVRLVYLEGELGKKGSYRRNWLRRHVSLDGRFLRYYKPKVRRGALPPWRDPALKRKKALGELDLDSAALLQRTSSQKHPHGLSLQVQGRTLLLEASSAAEAKRWYDGISANICFLARSSGFVPVKRRQITQVFRPSTNSLEYGER